MRHVTCIRTLEINVGFQDYPCSTLDIEWFYCQKINFSQFLAELKTHFRP